jgi:N-acetylneuraminic acid mutarotase
MPELRRRRWSRRLPAIEGLESRLVCSGLIATGQAPWLIPRIDSISVPTPTPTPTPSLGHWETGPSAPVALAEVAGGIIGNSLYLVGEGNPATLAYNLVTHTWIDNLAARPFPGNHHAAEVVDGKLYILGGLDSGQGKVQIYDPATNQWSLGADMPFGAGSCASSIIGGQIYVAGGIVGTADNNRLARYDPATNQWTELAAMPVARNHTASATDGQKLYIFGGRDAPNRVANGFADVQIYDPATNTWDRNGSGTGIPPLPQARGGMGKAVFLNGEFYVIGGETLTGAGATAAGVYSRVDVYNPTTRQWRLAASIPTARHGIFPLLFDGQIYVACGGVHSGESASEVLEIYAPN